MAEDLLLALLPKARRRWARTDPVLHGLVRDHPPEGAGLSPAGSPFEALVESLTHQQVSLAAGRTIHGRTLAACGGAATPEAILRLGADGLRSCGLSRSKAAYALDLARKSVSGEVDLASLVHRTDEEVVEALTRVKGIGVWTAKMFLLFHLRRPDVHAPEDLGLQIAVADAYRVPRARAAAKMARMREAWSPYNSLAALTLWNWRRVRMEQAADAPPRKTPSRKAPARGGLTRR